MGQVMVFLDIALFFMLVAIIRGFLIDDLMMSIIVTAFVFWIMNGEVVGLMWY